MKTSEAICRRRHGEHFALDLRCGKVSLAGLAMQVSIMEKTKMFSRKERMLRKTLQLSISWHIVLSKAGAKQCHRKTED